MSRTARLLELLIRLRTAPRFTAGELAAEFGVSRRTMLRDLQTLSELGVPLIATPGPGGGYVLARNQRLTPLALTVDEALGILMSYEAFLKYAQSPFAVESLSAVTKMRASLAPDTVRELDRIKRHVAIITRSFNPSTPLLGDLLRAALDGVHLRVVYDSRAGVSERVIFPFGLFAMDGFWYCACHDERRDARISLRADRFISLERLQGRGRLPHVPVAQWFEIVERDDGHGLFLRATVNARGMKSFDLQRLFGYITPHGEDGGVIEATIPRAEIEWYAAQLLPAGADVIVESPPELITAIRRQAHTVVTLYRE